VKRYPTHKPGFIAALCNDRHGDEQVIVWVTFDEEGDQLAALIPGSVHLSGRTPRDRRLETIGEFREGRGPRVLIVKPSMFAYGLNLQSCSVQVFSTITDSFERYYQAIRRSWRYGQVSEVRVYVPLTDLDEAICQNVLSKQETFMTDAAAQEAEYVAVLRPADTTERPNLVTIPQAELDRVESDAWTLVHGDCIAHMPTMDEASMDLAIFSPPFANLFTYSREAGDMGNTKSDLEYRLQWKFFADELARIMRPGRIVAIHCADIIRFAGQHGHRHTYDYPSDVRAGMEDAGFYYCARIAIDKNPQIQATRTKDQNLLFATLKRDALDSHPQASECVLVFRKPGEPETPVKHAEGTISNVEWIAWAHHVWYDIRETDVLNAALGKEHDDERHICPLQLGLIERCVRLWSSPGETVFSPFAGIGSEGYTAIGWDRRFYGVELKRSYFDTATRFLREREQSMQSRLPLETPA
jgi:DNA modification methylase